MKQVKPQLVLLHGLFGSPLGLENIAEDLRAADCEVFVPAVPPFAGSIDTWLEQAEILGEADLNQRYAHYFKEYFAKNGIKKPILIGHSMGTLVASSIVAHYPELLDEHVILMSPISSRPNGLISRASVFSSRLPAKTVDWITTRYLSTPRDQKQFRETLKIVNQCSLEQRPSKKHIAQATGFSADSTILENLNSTTSDKKFQIHLLAGERDRLIPPAANRKATEELQKMQNGRFAAECVFLPGTGHLHNYEKPHETAQQVLKFLRK